MAKRPNVQPFTWLLLAMVVLLLAGLLGTLLAGSPSQAAQTAEAVDAEGDPPAEDEEEAPLWLQPAEPEEETVQEKEPPEGERSAPEILAEAQIIAHGMGAMEGVATLNCLEGFQQQYERGVRVFEADLRLTSDLQVVLRHDWRAGWQAGISETQIPSLTAFLNRPILERYTPLSFRDLLLLMEEYPDICVITDSKFTDAEIVTLQFEAMLEDARELGLSYLFDRMIIQVYSELMYKVVDNIHPFPHYIYTLYAEGFGRTEDAFREIAAFCSENGILGITMWDYWWNESYLPIAQEYGLRVFAHPVNDPQEALALLESGVSAVYTDTLAPGSLEPTAES